MALNLKQIDWKRIVIGALIGGLLGYAYYYFIGCRSGSCPLTSNPVRMTIYGAFFGIVLFFQTKPKKTKS